MKLRTIHEAILDVRKRDRDTSLTEYRLKQFVNSGLIPSVKYGTGRNTRHLIDIDTLEDNLRKIIKESVQ